MARIQQLAGQLKLGELDDCSVYYDDANDQIVITDISGGVVARFGNDGNHSQLALHGRGFRQCLSVRLRNGDGDARNDGTLVEASGGTDDGFTQGAINSTAIIGVVCDGSINAGADGKVAVAGVVNILLTAAGVRGQYVATGAVAGQGTCQAGLPAAGRTVAMCIQNTGGAGLARCVLTRM